MNQFDIPVAVFLFKRFDSLDKIFNVLRQVQPLKLYIFSDAGRNDEEKLMVEKVRNFVETAVDWNCDLVKDYAVNNRGVFENIGLGALKVFSYEEQAIFIEDDNLPAISFFNYCKQMLSEYEENDKVLWVCGTNYLGEYNNGRDDYFFTKHLLPCGWASWRYKFLKYYDAYLDTVSDNTISNLKGKYESKALYYQQMRSLQNEIKNKKNSQKFRSWDYQMMYSIRNNDLYGISPKYNQICNIGDDSLSTHDTSRKNSKNPFCDIPTRELSFPLKHSNPENIVINKKYENKIKKIILYPLNVRLRLYLSSTIKKILGRE